MLNFKDFKKVQSNQKSTTLKHKDGHTIRIAHDALSPTMKKQLSALPQHLDEGGPVQKSAWDKFKDDLGDAGEEINGPTDPGSSQSGTDFASMYNAPSTPAPQAQDTAAPPTIAGPAPASVPPAPQPGAHSELPMQPQNQDPMGYDAYGNMMLKGLGMQQGGVQAQANAEGKLGQQEAAAAQQSQQQMQQLMADHQKYIDQGLQDYNHFRDDYMQGHIDPKHYWNGLSGGKQAMTAIGLILGGMGSGLTGQENMAAKFLNQQIERDVDAQKQNMGKSENLMNMSMKMMGNMQDATRLATALQTNIYSAKLQQAAAQSKDPLAQARAMQQAGLLQQQGAQIVQQLYSRKYMMQGLQGSADPSQKIRFGEMMGMIPKGQAEPMYKELASAQAMSKGRDALLSGFDQVAQKNTIANRAMHPYDSGKEIGALWEPNLAQLVKDSEGRITPQDTQMIDTLKPNPGESDAVQALKRRRLDAFISQKMNFPQLKAYGIDPSPAQRYADSGDKKIQLGPPVRK